MKRLCLSTASRLDSTGEATINSQSMPHSTRNGARRMSCTKFLPAPLILKLLTDQRLVFVHDPTDSDDYVIPIGKQTLRPSHIFYTPCSGIWQSVWVEPAPANYITQLDVDADMHGQGKWTRILSIKSIDPNVVNVTVHSSSQAPVPVQVVVYDSGTNNIIASQNSTSDAPFLFTVSSPKLWSPDSPTLYNLSVRMGSDEVDSYTGFRTISKGTVDGVVRPLLNGEFMFMFGTLDQGFWPDGIYTPPNREAMVYDLQTLKNLGFNMLRKHVGDLSHVLNISC